MQKILITGGAGYIGTVLTSLALKKGFSVIALDNLKHSKIEFIKKFKKNKNYKFSNCDINNLNKFEKVLKKEKVNIIVHLAGIVGDPASKLQKKLTRVTNLQSSRKLFKLSEKHNVSKFIFSSTCSNYGIVNSKSLANEKSKLKPLSLYAETKVDFEKFMIDQSKKVKMQLIIMRFATVFGISDRMRFDLTINQFTRDLYFNKELNIFGQNTWRPYCHVMDVSRAILYSLKSKEKINIFNVGNSKQNYSKKFVISAIGKFIPLKNLTYSKQEISDKRDYKVNFSKINKVLNFKTKYNLNAGIKEIIAFLKKNKKNYFYNKIYSNT
jgi:nucleoside-diphosphate-sugar epimerase